DQPDVLETERELEPGRAEGAPAHPFAVRLVDRRSEERAIERLEHREAVQPGLLDESERLGQRLEHRREQEVPGKLDEVRAARIVADARHPAAQRSQHGERRLQGPRETALPVLRALSRGVSRVGDDPSRANLVKLAGNFLLASMLETLAEAFALVEKA